MNGNKFVKDDIYKIVGHLSDDYQFVIDNPDSKFNGSRIEKHVETWLEKGTYTISILIDFYENGKNIAYIDAGRDRSLKNILIGRRLSKGEMNSLQELLIEFMKHVKDGKIQQKKRINTDQHTIDIKSLELARIQEY